ncbi:hypothetical protein BC827DRAFT_1245948 [Russula dissimulans]|nr:hypothetical protein BC827DRAFT_1245948 [Russula dissimulans]
MVVGLVVRNQSCGGDGKAGHNLSLPSYPSQPHARRPRRSFTSSRWRERGIHHRRSAASMSETCHHKMRDSEARELPTATGKSTRKRGDEEAEQHHNYDTFVHETKMRTRDKDAAVVAKLQ